MTERAEHTAGHTTPVTDKTGGPAFAATATSASDDIYHQSGMTLRDYFAARAMAGLCANPGGPYQANDISGWGIVNCEVRDIANTAYRIADAMIAARATGEA